MKIDNEIPKEAELRWEWIKFQLRSKGTSLAQLARQLGVERNALNNVKRVAYPRMERAIAKALGLTPFQIWPERWDQSGEPFRLRPGRSEKSSEIAQKSNGLSPKAHHNAGKA